MLFGSQPLERVRNLSAFAMRRSGVRAPAAPPINQWVAKHPSQQHPRQTQTFDTKTEARDRATAVEPEMARTGARRIRHRFVAPPTRSPESHRPSFARPRNAAGCGVAPRRLFPRNRYPTTRDSFIVTDARCARRPRPPYRWLRVGERADSIATENEPDAGIAQQAQPVCAGISSDLPSSPENRFAPITP